MSHFSPYKAVTFCDKGGGARQQDPPFQKRLGQNQLFICVIFAPIRGL